MSHLLYTITNLIKKNFNSFLLLYNSIHQSGNAADPYGIFCENSFTNLSGQVIKLKDLKTLVINRNEYIAASFNLHYQFANQTMHNRIQPFLHLGY